MGWFLDEAFVERGFRYADGVVTPLEVPGSLWTSAWGTNDAGQIVGQYHDGRRPRGFLFEDGQFTSIDVSETMETFPFDINNRGQVVGWSHLSVDVRPTASWRSRGGWAIWWGGCARVGQMISPFTPLAATGLRSRRTIRHTPAGQRTDRRRALRPAHPVGEFLLGLTREIDRERIMGDELTPGQGLSAIDALQIEGLPMIASVSQRRSARWLDFLLAAVAHSFSQEPPLVR